MSIDNEEPEVKEETEEAEEVEETQEESGKIETEEELPEIPEGATAEEETAEETNSEDESIQEETVTPENEENEQIDATQAAYFTGETEGLTEKRTSSFTNLVCNEQYVFLVMKTEDENNLLESENILYIDQGKADENGNISFSYILKESYQNAVVRVYGKSTKNMNDSLCTISLFRGQNDKSSYTISVKYGQTELKENVDYILSFENVENSNVTLSITGIGDYSGKKTISKVELGNLTVTVKGVKVPENSILILKNQKSKESKSQTNDGKFTQIPYGEYELVTDYGSKYIKDSTKLSIWDSEPIDVELKSRLYGDVYEDGKIDVIDVDYTRRNVAEFFEFDEMEKAAADFNKDGTIDVKDCLYIRKYASGIISDPGLVS